MTVDTRDDRRAETLASTTVRVEPTTWGRWQVATPDLDRIIFDSLDDARHAAYVSAARIASCELVVHDAYHRVLSREIVNARS